MSLPIFHVPQVSLLNAIGRLELPAFDDAIGRLELPAFDDAIGRLRGLGRGLACGLAGLIGDLLAAASHRGLASRGRGLPVEPGQAGEVVDQIGHADLGAGADHADGPHDQPEAGFLGGEDMLDAGP